jgi:hypothetical protein
VAGVMEGIGRRGARVCNAQKRERERVCEGESECGQSLGGPMARPRPRSGGNGSWHGPGGAAEQGTRGSGWVKRKGEWRGGRRVGPTRGGAQLTEAGRGCRVGP